MSGHVEHVVNSTDDPEITVLVAPATVTGKIASFDFTPVCFLITLRVAPDSAEHAGPWFSEDEFVSGIGRKSVAIIIDDFGDDTKKGQGGCPGFGRSSAGKGSDHDRARLGLPPCVHNGTTL